MGAYAVTAAQLGEVLVESDTNIVRVAAESVEDFDADTIPVMLTPGDSVMLAVMRTEGDTAAGVAEVQADCAPEADDEPLAGAVADVRALLEAERVTDGEREIEEEPDEEGVWEPSPLVVAPAEGEPAALAERRGLALRPALADPLLDAAPERDAAPVALEEGDNDASRVEEPVRLPLADVDRDAVNALLSLTLGVAEGDPVTRELDEGVGVPAAVCVGAAREPLVVAVATRPGEPEGEAVARILAEASGVAEAHNVTPPVAVPAARLDDGDADEDTHTDADPTGALGVALTQPLALIDCVTRGDADGGRVAAGDSEGEPVVDTPPLADATIEGDVLSVMGGLGEGLPLPAPVCDGVALGGEVRDAWPLELADALLVVQRLADALSECESVAVEQPLARPDTDAELVAAGVADARPDVDAVPVAGTDGEGVSLAAPLDDGATGDALVERLA
jgi:hypothetical protein